MHKKEFKLDVMIRYGKYTVAYIGKLNNFQIIRSFRMTKNKQKCINASKKFDIQTAHDVKKFICYF